MLFVRSTLFTWTEVVLVFLLLLLFHKPACCALSRGVDNAISVPLAIHTYSFRWSKGNYLLGIPNEGLQKQAQRVKRGTLGLVVPTSAVVLDNGNPLSSFSVYCNSCAQKYPKH